MTGRLLWKWTRRFTHHWANVCSIRRQESRTRPARLIEQFEWFGLLMSSLPCYRFNQLNQILHPICHCGTLLRETPLPPLHAPELEPRGDIHIEPITPKHCWDLLLDWTGGIPREMPSDVQSLSADSLTNEQEAVCLMLSQPSRRSDLLLA